MGPGWEPGPGAGAQDPHPATGAPPGPVTAVDTGRIIGRIIGPIDGPIAGRPPPVRTVGRDRAPAPRGPR